LPPTAPKMRIHHVTYATPRFRLRQLVLGWSAQLNRVADTVTHWTPEKLLSAGFEARCKDIKLTERGSGFWAWKPYIIEAKLREIPDGDIVFYCDVGRAYPFKQLTNSIAPFLDWMANHGQSVFPGVHIPWKGPMSMWTKRDAYVLTQLDQPAVHSAIPIQASFSLWRACPSTINIVSEWMEMSSRRTLISDDPSTYGTPELPDFHDHRHDQSLLTLCCLKHGIKGLDIGNAMPPIDTQHPSAIACFISGSSSKNPHLAGRILKAVVRPLEVIEANLRTKVSFGEPIPEPSKPSANSDKNHFPTAK
ncbi:MAG: hypothetical protein ACK49N_06095, partial [Verrucomicrobiota bacterium]